MELNELRIGNLLLVNGILKKLSLQMLYEGGINEYCKPILITEEWIFKFGFEKIRYEKYAHSKLNNLRLYPHVMKDGFGVFLKDSYTFPHIKYVHQLQNLYFELTGEEL